MQPIAFPDPGVIREMISRAALLDAVWAGRVVEDDVLSSAIIKLCKALGDGANNLKFV